MSDSTKWVDWHPQVGDVRPDVYRVRFKCSTFNGYFNTQWTDGKRAGHPLEDSVIDVAEFQIPAPKETAMKYWQPRIEPMVKGWTLADVPARVQCDTNTNDGKCIILYRLSDTEVFRVDDKGMEVRTHYKPSECRVIRVIDPLPAGAMTLDKVPEGVRCVVDFDGTQRVCKKIRDAICGSDGVIYVPQRGAVISVLHILDPLPEISVTLDTLPVGRVIKQGTRYWFRCKDSGWFEWFRNIGALRTMESPDRNDKFTVTDIIMELKEVV